MAELSEEQLKELEELMASGASDEELNAKKQEFSKENEPGFLSRLFSRPAMARPEDSSEKSIIDEERPKHLEGLRSKLPPIAPRKPVPSKEEPVKKEPSKVSPSAEAPPPSEKQESWTSKEKRIQEIRAEMTPEQRASFDKEYADVEAMRKQAIDAYREDKKAADWGRVAEMLGRAALKLAAGYSGLKSGQDMSGAVDSAEKWDWKTDYDNIKEELRMTLDSAEAKRKGTERKEDRITRENEDTTKSMRGEFSASENDKRQRIMNKDRDKGELRKFDAARKEALAKNKHLAFADESKEISAQLEALEKAARIVPSEKGKYISTEQAAMLPIDITKLPEGSGFWGTKSGTVDAAALNAAINTKRQELLSKKNKLRGELSSPEEEAAPAAAAELASNEEVITLKDGRKILYRDKKPVREIK